MRTLLQILAGIHKRLLSIEANPRYLALFRISYCLVALPIAIQTIQYIPFRWFDLPSTLQLGALIANWLWIALLILLLIGLGGRLIPFLIFLITPHLLDPTVGTKLLMIGSFWMSFMRANECFAIRFSTTQRRFELTGLQSSLESVPGWAALLLGYNLGFLLFTAGISKSLDPLWFHGLGFYYTLIHPWLKISYASPLLDLKELMYGLNYASLALEALVLPLFIWKRLRMFSVILIFLFFSSLTFPIRIDPIGPAGIVLVIPLIAVIPTFQSIIHSILKRVRLQNYHHEESDESSHAGLKNTELHSTSLRVSSWEKVGAVLVSVLLLLDVLSASAPALIALEYPLVNYPFTIEERSGNYESNDDRVSQSDSSGSGISDSERDRPTPTHQALRGRLGSIFEFTWSIRNYYRTARGAQFNYSLVGWYSPFNLKHIIGRYTYRVLVTTENGEVKEPLKIFHEDKTTGPPSGGILRPRVLQNRMWALGLLSHKMSLYDDYAPTDSEIRLLRALIQFQISKLGDLEKDRVDFVSIMVSPILLPASYEGDVAPWIEAKWIELYRYSSRQDEYGFVDRPEPYEVNIDLPEFHNYRIFINP